MNDLFLSEETNHFKKECKFHEHINRFHNGVKIPCKEFRKEVDEESGLIEHCSRQCTRLACEEYGYGYCHYHYQQKCLERGWANNLGTCANVLCDQWKIPLEWRRTITVENIERRLGLSNSTFCT